MIYLIDDNKKRQQDSGWNDAKFDEYKDFLQPIYRLSEITDALRNELFKTENNVILFHESFFENFENKQVNDVNDIRNKLEKLSHVTSNRYYVIFSGSNSERKLNENDTSASIPVHILYNNLEVFIQKHQTIKKYDLRYLLFGINPDIEPLLLEELNKAKRLFIEEDINISNELDDYFFFRSRLDFNTLNKNHITIFNKDSEFGLHNLIKGSLSNVMYKGIFIPLCFGNSLSDFNGLRLATEIRCTNTINQCTPIFIYGFVGIEYLLQNEHFNILKTKGVELVEYRKKAFHNVTSLKTNPITSFELTNEIRKLELNPPKNYLDNHSIANEWSILRWYNAIFESGIIDYIPDEIEAIESKINSNLYYKYLTCRNPINDKRSLKDKDLKLKNNGKILYIDDENEKGWNELFCALLYNGQINKVENYESLGSEFKELSSDEIINLSVNKAKDFDLVILDFRLTGEDFYEGDPKKITGYRILEKIKAHNKGIQVVIFSATNKVWNLQALQKAGADGFIVKESPENSMDSQFTIQSIKNIIETIDSCLERKYLKELVELKKSIESVFKLNPLVKYYPNNFSCLRGIQYQNLLLLELTSMFDILNSQNENRYNHAMLMQFKLIECINEIFIPEKKSGRWFFWDNTEMKYFYLVNSTLNQPNAELDFFDFNIKRIKNMKIPAHEYNSTRNKIDCLIEQKFVFDDRKEIHKKLKELIDYRNSSIHPKDRLSLNPLRSENILSWMGLINQIILKI